MNDPFFSRFAETMLASAKFPFPEGVDPVELITSHFEIVPGRVGTVHHQRAMLKAVMARILQAQGGRGYPARHERLLKSAADWTKVDPAAYAEILLEACAADHLLGIPNKEEWAKDNALGKSLSVAFVETAVYLFTVKDIDWVVNMRCCHHASREMEEVMLGEVLNILVGKRTDVLAWILPGAHRKTKTLEHVLQLFLGDDLETKDKPLDTAGYEIVTLCMRDESRDIPDEQMSEMLNKLAKPKQEAARS
ncbi:hypothetical protein IT407_03580 [Candidatus Uhrbacteria bacterium]|nr:hypothetical protein [Candidatus Uhrbacteria bacterium]